MPTLFGSSSSSSGNTGSSRLIGATATSSGSHHHNRLHGQATGTPGSVGGSSARPLQPLHSLRPTKVPSYANNENRGDYRNQGLAGSSVGIKSSVAGEHHRQHIRNSHIPCSNNSNFAYPDKPSLRQIVIDENEGCKYELGRFLGKGGFAKCYELTDIKTKASFAGKIVPKSTLVKARAKHKLSTEIKIHRSIKHHHIVGFEHFFEDNENVYIVLEMCSNKSMMELMKRRHRLSDPETRYYMKQIIDATQHMHKHNIIHRDLKLGNLFLNSDMQIKIGDFGLASRVAYEGERKRTVCGTPNYIAPEILENSGHSYEVDIWSIGVILYTLLVGKPPFETESVKATYKRIRDNKFSFPIKHGISEQAMNLITSILHPKPEHRPTLEEILEHSYFHEGHCPNSLPTSALILAPNFEDAPKGHRSSSRSKAHGYEAGPHRKDTKILPITKSVAALHTKERLGRRYGGNTEVGVVESPVPNASVASSMKDSSRRTSLEEIRQLVSKVVQTRPSSSTKNVEEAAIQPTNLPPLLFVSKWVDYSDKYGLGYTLCDGSAGVLFNDCSRIILAPDSSTVEYVYNDKATKTTSAKIYTIDQYPPELYKKITLLKHFRNYMMERLQGGSVVSVSSSENDSNAVQKCKYPHVKKWLRTKKAIVFRLSNKIIQVNFFDHAKVILSAEMNMVTYINHARENFTYYFSDVMNSGQPDLISHLGYVKDIIEHMATKQQSK
eukprot:Nk52_evm30s2309 gene=Nk52_evmTU30s2309